MPIKSGSHFADAAHAQYEGSRLKLLSGDCGRGFADARLTRRISCMNQLATSLASAACQAICVALQVPDGEAGKLIDSDEAKDD
jgi:hypothetical protein